MKKENLKPFTFYKWIEITKQEKFIDICFIIDINKISSPGDFQCSGIEIENIKSDLIVGREYTYHFLWKKEKIKSRKYIIKEINFNSINRKMFFDQIFNPDSELVRNLYLHYTNERFKNLRK